MNVRTKPDLFAKPAWAKLFDRKVDASDAWVDEIDPENVDGKYVEAFLIADGFSDAMRVVGISVQCELTTTYYDRDAAVILLGRDAITRIEQHEMEAAL